MKQFIIINLFILLIACEKSAPPSALVAFNVVNATSTSVAKVKTPHSGNVYSVLKGINSGTSAVISVLPSEQLTLFGTDTIKPFYTTEVSALPGEIYSLYITGESSADILMKKDIIPYYRDSIMGVRFINLSSNSEAVNIKLAGSASGTEFIDINYKDETEFKTYGTKLTDATGYSFEAWDANGVLLATSPVISSKTVRFKNITLVLKGLSGETGANQPTLFIVNNY